MMKRGKDDEKIMGPMFPRLHVNDTGKGGPRAPPRNKMALYEQLSVPSQRFNHGVLPLNPSNSRSLVPPSSSSQGGSLERNMVFQSRASPSTSTNLAEKFHSHQLEGASENAPSLGRIEHRNKVRDEDDFMVPVFVNTETGQQHNRKKNGFDREKLAPLSPAYPGHQIKTQNVCDIVRNQTSSSGVSVRKEARDHSEETSKVCSSRECSVETAPDLSTRDKIDLSTTRDKIDGCAEEANLYPNQDIGELPASRLNRSHGNGACSLLELGAGRQLAVSVCLDAAVNGCIGGSEMIDIGEETLSRKRSMSNSEGNPSVPDETNNDSEWRGDKTCGSLQCANGDKSDDVSETSMIDSISGLDISPDDVVGIIGQKHFWKARRAIINQQRVFAVQVFELHRLIKVQRLIAGSPNILLENSAYLGKPSFQASPAKKLPPEFIVKPLLHAKRKDDSEKPSDKLECSAENAVGRTSPSSVKNGSQPSNYGPFLGNSPPAPVNGDNKLNPWCFPQMPGHQWLVPVMSPSEGLVYKPYSGPGFMGSACGGCGPFGQTPMTGNFMTSACGVPVPPYQGIGILPGAPPVVNSYFPPYGMPVMNPAVSASAVEQMNQFAGPGHHAHNGQLSGGGGHFNMQQQSSCNLPCKKNGAISHVMNVQPSKDTEIQGSTASSPTGRVQGDGTSSAAEGKNPLPLFPTAPANPEGASQPNDTDRRTRVIKVVPHNARSATESAARIFQSIQKERERYDSV